MLLPREEPLPPFAGGLAVFLRGRTNHHKRDFIRARVPQLPPRLLLNVRIRSNVVPHRFKVRLLAIQFRGVYGFLLTLIAKPVILDNTCCSGEYEIPGNNQASNEQETGTALRE